MPIPDPFRCDYCQGVNTHYLTCETLRLQPGWAQRAADEEMSTR